MDLVAGDSGEIVRAIAADDRESFADRSRFDAHVSLGGGLDPTWLDLFAEAARSVMDSDEPGDFLDARRELDDPADTGDRTVELVEADWLAAVARIPDARIDAVAGRWIDLVEEELGELPREEKPWIRGLAGEIVRFAKGSVGSAAVVFAWSP